MKSVTIMSFGPSLYERKVDVASDSEIWSLNDCWDVFHSNAQNLMDRLTRIYEMHDMDKRLDVQSVINGYPHLANMDRWGQMGKRIIMQKPCPTIRGSEAYPLVDVESFVGTKAFTDYWGFDFWNGTPPYMLAHAIVDGYRKIQLIGCDADEFRHNRQRRTMTYLMGFGRALGYEITGVMMNSGRPTKRYGYDYGPEWDAEQNADACRGWPAEIIWNHLDWRKKK